MTDRLGFSLRLRGPLLPESEGGPASCPTCGQKEDLHLLWHVGFERDHTLTCDLGHQWRDERVDADALWFLRRSGHVVDRLDLVAPRVPVSNPVRVKGPRGSRWSIVSCPSCGRRRHLVAEKAWDPAQQSFEGPVMLECVCTHRWSAPDVGWIDLKLNTSVARQRAWLGAHPLMFAALGAGLWLSTGQTWGIVLSALWWAVAVLWWVLRMPGRGGGEIREAGREALSESTLRWAGVMFAGGMAVGLVDPSPSPLLEWLGS